MIEIVSPNGTSRMISFNEIFKPDALAQPSDVLIHKEAPRFAPPSTTIGQANPESLALCAWTLGKISYELHEDDTKTSFKDTWRTVDYYVNSPPFVWTVTRFISDIEPTVLIEDGLHYVLIHMWNNRIEVHKEVSATLEE